MAERETEKGDTVEIMMRRLCHAAIEGNVALLANLHHEDPLLLDRYQLYEGQFGSPPLHVASKLGHFEFVMVILEMKRGLADELDSNKSSPLHLSSANGHLNIVKELLKVSPSMCLSHDFLGRNPLHVAIIKGQLDVLEVLVRAMPQVARDCVGGLHGETALHLCVKFGQLEALKFLVKNSICDNEFLNAKDSDGNTILHIAMANKQHEIIKFLVTNDKISKNALNAYGSTAMDIFEESPRDTKHAVEIWNTLRSANFLRAAQLRDQNTGENRTIWLENQRSTLMVVASLIATMAFQAGLNPPGGTWQNNDSSDYGTDNSTAAYSVMATTSPSHYELYSVLTTIGLVSSMSIIILLISGLQFRGVSVRIMTMFMWIAVTAMTWAYSIGIYFFMLRKHRSMHYWISEISILVALGLMALLMLSQSMKLGARLFRKALRCGLDHDSDPHTKV